MWSTWPWVIAMWVGSTSSAVATAAGLLGFRNGSTRTVVSPSLSSKHEWPWNLISIAQLLSFGFGLGSRQLLVQCPADGDANHHPHPRLLGEQGATAAIRSSGSGTVAAFSASASCDSPNQPPSASAAASTFCSCGAARATIRSASAKRSASISRSIAASSSLVVGHATEPSPRVR